MTYARREFHEFDNGEQFTSAPPEGLGQDYALVIGVNDYPKLRPLRGAVADAMAFAAWLVAEDGGRVPAANVRNVLSTPDPLTPIGHEINDALEDILERAYKSGGRRFYFYFSGHGCVGDRASDISLCMANWSELRRRAALSSDAWLDIVVRSGAFGEVVFFLDCCRVWAVRAVGLPPHIDFAKPVEREVPTRVFVAFATEFQRAAVESPVGETTEVRGIFTRVLIDGLYGNARWNGLVTADSLKRHLEKNVTQQAKHQGFGQRAEVLNGLEAEARFGFFEWSGPIMCVFRPRPTSSFARLLIRIREVRVPSSLEVRNGLEPWLPTHATDQWQHWLAAIAACVNPLPAITAVSTTGANGRCRMLVVLVDKGLSGIGWAIHSNRVAIAFNRENTWTDDARGSVFSARLAPCTYTLRWANKRDFVIRLYPGYDTQFVIDHDESTMRLGSPRFFLVPWAESSHKPPAYGVANAVEHGLALLGDASGNVPELLVNIIAGKPFNDPTLGLLAAYLLAHNGAPDPELIAAIANRLESMLGPCPDVHALRLRSALLWGTDLPKQRCTEPPVFRDGLLAFVEASHHVPEIVVPGSLLEYACVHRLVDSAISSWPSQTDAMTNDNDWLAVAVADMAIEHLARGKSIDARTIAKELGVPTLAVQARLRENMSDYIVAMRESEKAMEQAVQESGSRDDAPEPAGG